ncbi:hypothetical protein NQZ68_004605 [Dissostichus eleginoides]|uniref:Dynein heavy chain-like protein n=1 Tax=Dissostichus eleginoides TaxID=100907 RepID=A0AAD9CAC8_DISEL|nr:hypothetical protein NQZ68_004605 [Dissostichus eleginoides]KAK1897278.1 Dynein heavy chain-like protein [Dissostichus eleginoides]
MERGHCKVEEINRKGSVREKNERKSWRRTSSARGERTVTGKEKISQEERGGVKKGQVEREESSEETTGEHKPREKTEEKTGGERRNLENGKDEQRGKDKRGDNGSGDERTSQEEENGIERK